MKSGKSFGGVLPFDGARKSADGAFKAKGATGLSAGRMVLYIALIAVVLTLCGVLLSVWFGPHT